MSSCLLVLLADWHDRPFWSTSLIFAVFLATIVGHGYFTRRHLPPGPRRLPLIGNALQYPSKTPWLRFTEWSKEFGPVFSLDLLGRPVIVLNTHKAATDLLDRRSAIYSSRPRMIMMCEILGGGLMVPFMSDNNCWRKHRRAAHNGFHPKAIEKFQSIHFRTAVEQTILLLANPNSWEHHLDLFASAGVLRSVYGWPAATPPMKSHIDRMRNFVERLMNAARPGAFLVDVIPAMLYLPEWLAPWKKDGMECFQQYANMLESLGAGEVNQANEDSRTAECFAQELNRDEPRCGLSNEESAWLAGTMFTAGAETLYVTLRVFVLAMILYPDAMHAAQTEIDTVVGRDRTPTFEDLDSLPYIQAVIKEVLRWRTAAPNGVPHCTTEDDWYDGYFIPKGTTIIPNQWAMNRDPAFYPDFDAFRPERFLEKSGPAAGVLEYTHGMGHVTYGFGRRICVGMHYANQALFIIMTTMLWAADIGTSVVEDRKSALLAASNIQGHGISAGPASFTASISPRFPEARTVLERTLGALS